MLANNQSMLHVAGPSYNRSVPFNNVESPFWSKVEDTNDFNKPQIPRIPRNVESYLRIRARRFKVDESIMLHEWLRRLEAKPQETLEELETLLFKEWSTITWVNTQAQIANHIDPKDSNVFQEQAGSMMLSESISSPFLRAHSLSPVPGSVIDYEDYSLHRQQKRFIEAYHRAEELWGCLRQGLVKSNPDELPSSLTACRMIQEECLQQLDNSCRLRTQIKTGVVSDSGHLRESLLSCRTTHSAQMYQPVHLEHPVASKPPRIFNANLSSYCKDDLREIAAAFGLDQFGLKKDLMKRIRTHMDDHPELGDEQRFKTLFARRRRSP